MESKELIKQVINNPTNTNKIAVIAAYCIGKGKDVNMVEDFLTIAMQIGWVEKLFEIAFYKIIEEENILLVHNEKGDIIAIN